MLSDWLPPIWLGLPFSGEPVTITDQSGESTKQGAVCEEKKCIDENCVNQLLQMGKGKFLGLWGPVINCNTVVAGILTTCRKKNCCEK